MGGRGGARGAGGGGGGGGTKRPEAGGTESSVRQELDKAQSDYNKLVGLQRTMIRNRGPAAKNSAGYKSLQRRTAQQKATRDAARDRLTKILS